jgi:hypothetical protein
LTQQTKDDAREESLRRWHALPPTERQTTEQAQIFAAALAADLDFRTMGNRRMVILGWLVRDLDGLPAWGNIPPESMKPVSEPTVGGEAADDASETDIDLPAAPENVAGNNDNDAEDGDDDALWRAAE